jgi:hypothetical protein
MNRYDGILMLSGGKDSTYLAYQLKEQEKNILAVTVDVGFVVDTAKQNIERVIDDLGMDHLYIKSQKDEHKKLIDQFYATPSWGLPEICGKCTQLTFKTGIEVLQLVRGKTIYTGFTPHSVHKLSSGKITVYGGYVYESPYYEEYDCPKMCAFLNGKGYVTDPTLTNCKHIHNIIALHIERFGENPYESEIDSMLNADQITEDEAKYYTAWCFEPRTGGEACGLR